MSAEDDAYRCFWEIKDPLTKVFSKKFNCDIELKGPQLLAARSGSDDSECVYEKALNQGLRITVKKGDMTRQDTDAVVNAANEHLDHIGGLALALVKAGGQQIVHESNQHIAKHGKVKVGGVAVTSGGNLPCKVIIHAVGPMWSSYRPQECESNLEEAIKGVLGYVTNHSNIQSVSIPAVSSGIFGFPLARCGDIIVRTIKMFTSQVKCDHLREIRLVNHDHPTVNAMKTACDKVFGRGDHPRGSLATEINSTQATSATAHFPPAFNVNGLNLYLEKGNLEDQKTDVIVNSIAPDLDLSKGNLSFAILMKAGRKLQDEVFTSHSRSPYHNNHNVLCTPGLGLSCQSVYHTILPHYNDVHSDRALYTVVSKCLLDAELCNSHHSQNPPIPSISFPALGTGILNFPKKLVADIMTQTVYSYAHETRRRLDVHFVIHPQDKESFQTIPQVSESFTVTDYYSVLNISTIRWFNRTGSRHG
ncbi:hypothetical protein GDO86_016709 [Hymenochirus boettgeri]|uniref:Macro domain-containing protein n=1 Tax=Hymenochirus boettgeri TaxID=247094 RepID=A0A8T2IHJ4_9PIPI|nr:hypothetical protein GDO86_016709 [Hymenochirus boettgeri]